jgi:hypothetical protein
MKTVLRIIFILLIALVISAVSLFIVNGSDGSTGQQFRGGGGGGFHGGDGSTQDLEANGSVFGEGGGLQSRHSELINGGFSLMTSIKNIGILAVIVLVVISFEKVLRRIHRRKPVPVVVSTKPRLKMK